jgi:hypothetical protein
MTTLREIAKKIAALPEEEREKIMRKIDKWAQEHIDGLNPTIKQALKPWMPPEIDGYVELHTPISSDDKSSNILIPEGVYGFKRLGRVQHGRQLKSVVKLYGKTRNYDILEYRFDDMSRNGFIK